MATDYFSSASYEGAKRGLTQKRDADLAQNAYSRFLSQQRGDRHQEDVGAQWAQKWGHVGTPYGQRGLVNSGLYQEGVQNAAIQRFNDTNDARTAEQGDLRNADLKTASIQAAYQQSLANLALQTSQQRAAAAAQLEALK